MDLSSRACRELRAPAEPETAEPALPNAPSLSQRVKTLEDLVEQLRATVETLKAR
jgi:hypothetical protein